MLGFRPRRSSLIRRVLFDETSNTMSVSFSNSRQYTYHEVPRAVFDALTKAQSAGDFFNNTIRGRFRCEPVGRRFGPRD